MKTLSTMKMIAGLAIFAVALPAIAQDKKVEPKKPEVKKEGTKAPAAPAVTTAPAPAPAAAPADAPKIVIVESIKDYGTIPKGQELVWDFTVKNEGKADLVIDQVKPSCGCTVANFDKSIKPGATGKIGLKVETKAFSGPISKSATVTSNDPANPNMTIVIKAIVKPYVDVLPQGYVRFSAIQGEPAMQNVTLVTEEKTPFKVDKVDTPADKPWLTAKVVEVADKDRIQGRGDNKQYKVEISLGKEAPVGLLNEKLVAHTNIEKAQTIDITVSGLVRPLISVTPQQLNFGDVTVGAEPTTRNVIVAHNKEDKKDFKVTKVEILSVPPATDKGAKGQPVKGLVYELTPIQDGQRYQVVVKTDKDLAKGPIDAVMTISTNDKANPKFDVPIKGNVK